jgi:enoyl-CoA hydratase/carnithine racemase
MPTTEILYDEANGVGTITLNRPQTRNALTSRTYAELEVAVRSSTARCLVVTGADPASNRTGRSSAAAGSSGDKDPAGSACSLC